MGYFSYRRARLRPEFHWLYPGLPADTWTGARRLAHRQRRWSLFAQLREQVGQRVLPDDHFEFRGGERARQRVDVKTRTTDRAEAASGEDPGFRWAE